MFGDSDGGGVVESTVDGDVASVADRLAPAASRRAEKVALARQMKNEGHVEPTILKALGIGRTTLYRYLAETRASQPAVRTTAAPAAQAAPRDNKAQSAMERSRALARS